MTPEQQAVRQHLSKDRPFNGGCGCMGAQPIDPAVRASCMGWEQKWRIRITDFGQQPLAVVRTLRNYLPSISLKDALAAKNAGTYLTEDIGWQSRQEEIAHYLQGMGATLELVKEAPQMEPYCPCTMKWVEEVEGVYFMINEDRSPDGIKVTARCVGPKGGPYTL